MTATTIPDWWSPTGDAAAGDRDPAAVGDHDHDPRDDPSVPARPTLRSHRRMLAVLAVVPWAAAVVLFVGRGQSAATVDTATPVARVDPASRPNDAAPGILGAGEAGLVVSAARDLVASSGGDGTTRWAEHLVVEGAHQVRPGLRVVAVTAIVLQGRNDWTSVAVRAITVALVDGDEGTVPFAWWANGHARAADASSLEVLPEDDPTTVAAVQEALQRAGFAATRVLEIGSLPERGLFIAQFAVLDPSLGGERSLRVLLDATDLHVLEHPWGEP